MSETLNELNQALDHGVIERVDELKRGLDVWLKEIHSAPDPLSPLISDKGIWVLTSPLINTKSLIKTGLRIFAHDLAEKSGGKYRLSEVSTESKKLYVSISAGNKKLLTWSLFDACLEIPWFEEIMETQELIAVKRLEIDGVKKEFREVRTILKNPDAMISNGYYTLYLRSLFRKKKHREEVAEINRDFKNQIAGLEAQVAELESYLAALNKDGETLKCLKFMDVHYHKFPRVKTLSGYNNYRLKEVTHGS